MLERLRADGLGLTFPPRELVIDGRFRGPIGSGNGGYVCGAVAAFVPGSAEVTLRIPPPLEERLLVSGAGAGRVEVHRADGTLVAEARAVELELQPPRALGYDEAAAASAELPGGEHPFPECFVCGPSRALGDGLCLRPGPLADGLVAAPWVPDASLAGEDGTVHPEFLWSALDCPGAFAIDPKLERGISVLGRLAARLDGSVHAGERCAVAGWSLGEEGRKRYAGTALFGEDGRTVAVARATWILL